MVTRNIAGPLPLRTNSTDSATARAVAAGSPESAPKKRRPRMPPDSPRCLHPAFARWKEPTIQSGVFDVEQHRQLSRGGNVQCAQKPLVATEPSRPYQCDGALVALVAKNFAVVRNCMRPARGRRVLRSHAPAAGRTVTPLSPCRERRRPHRGHRSGCRRWPCRWRALLPVSDRGSYGGARAVITAHRHPAVGELEAQQICPSSCPRAQN